MNITLALRAIALSVAALLASGASQAAVVTYYFQDAGGNIGEFSFDDSNTVTVADPFSSGGAYYSALGFSAGGTTYASPVVGIYDNYGNGKEYFYVVDLVTDAFLQLENPGHGLFSGSDLLQMSGRSLADFAGGNLSPDGEALTYLSTTPIAGPVPEPAAAGMLLLGGLALALQRRRRRV